MILRLCTLLAAATLAAAGCEKSSTTNSGTQGGAKTAQTASMGAISNKRCPMVPADPINPKVTTSFKGKTVGFCCPGCIEDWDRLTEDQKQARLNKSM